MTKFFKGRDKPVKIKEPDPRSEEEISKEFESLKNQAGSLQYQIYVLKQVLENVNQSMMRVSKEGSDRKELDKKKAEAKNE